MIHQSMIWDKVYETLKFTPSMDKSIVPFEIKEEYAIYSFDFNEITEKQIDMMKVSRWRLLFLYR